VFPYPLFSLKNANEIRKNADNFEEIDD